MRRVSITDAAVIPAGLVVAPGAEVVWLNRGRNRHTVTADDGAFGSAVLFTGDHFAINAPARPGVYGYHCLFHSYIRGALTVSPVRLATPEPVDIGRTVTLRGSVPRGGAAEPVSVQRRTGGEWITVGASTASAAGAFSVISPPLTSSGLFRVLVGASISPSVPVQVRPLIRASRHGALLDVRVRPGISGWVVTLARLDQKAVRWRRVTSKGASDGRVRFILRSPGVYRAQIDAHAGLVGRASGPVTFG